MRKWLALVAFLAAILAPMTAFAQIFDNAAVIALHKAGLGDKVLLAKIDSLPCGYDVSTDALIALNRAGLSERVIAEMVGRCTGAVKAQGVADVSDPMAKHASGIYVLQDWLAQPKLLLLRPSALSGGRITGNGSILFPHIAKMVVPRSTAVLAIPLGRPVFYFYFENVAKWVGEFGQFSTRQVQSPQEFSLVRMKAGKDQRELTIGKVSVYNQERGIDPKLTIPFQIKEMADNIYQVTVDAGLATGEYAFILAGDKGHYRIYDFAIGVGGDSGR
jgi:hypothetical protein